MIEVMCILSRRSALTQVVPLIGLLEKVLLWDVRHSGS